jgi:hypothetical protein
MRHIDNVQLHHFAYQSKIRDGPGSPGKGLVRGTRGAHSSSMRQMKCRSLMGCLLSCSVLFAVAQAQGATLNAASTSLSDVQTAVNAAIAGDTVLVPAGSSTWSSALSIRKNISVIGAGTNATVITCSGTGVKLGASSAGICRLSGFRFNGPGYTLSYVDGVDIGAAYSCRVRVDHCWIQQFYMAVYAHSVGVVDHCTVVQCGRFARTRAPSYGMNPTVAEMNYVRDNWVPMIMDTTNAMFFESCRGVWPDYNNSYNILFSAQDGGGYVVRNCEFNLNFTGSYEQLFDFHGNQGQATIPGAMRGTYALGIYRNTFSLSGTTAGIQFALIRAGSGLIFSNSVSGSGFGRAHIDLFEEDAAGVWGYVGPPYYDQITNVCIWANPGITVGYTDTATESIVGAGVYWSSTAPAQLVTLAHPHPLVAAQEGGGPTNPVMSISPASLNFSSVLVRSTNTLTFGVQNVGGGILAGSVSVPTSYFSIVGPSTYSLAGGARQTITVRFVPEQVGPASQIVTFTGGGGATASVTGEAKTQVGLGMFFDSTDGELTLPFVTNASNTIFQDVETIDPAQGGKAIYTLNIPSTGNYGVGINVLAPADDANSIFVNFDSEPTSPEMIWDIPVSTTLASSTVTWRSTGGLRPKIWSLSAGSHQLIVRGREAGVALGRITIVPVSSPPTNLRVVAVGN